MTKKIKCLECGKEFKSLAQHVQVHGMEPYQYQVKYPGSPMVSPALHRSIKKRAKGARSRFMKEISRGEWN